jgi:ankyrin repeat protein
MSIHEHPAMRVVLHQYGRCTLEASDKTMPDVDILIELIRDHRNREALEMLKAFPALATEHSDRSGQLHGASPLHWAAHRNATDVCQRLIELGANVNDSASDWWLTPLAWGADAGSAEAVELLLKCGADVNQNAIVGTTALHAVAMGGSTQGKSNPNAYERTAEILIRNGAGINRRTKKQRTPLDEAIDNENDAVMQVLRQLGALASKTST